MIILNILNSQTPEINLPLKGILKTGTKVLKSRQS